MAVATSLPYRDERELKLGTGPYAEKRLARH